jgi:putative ATP-binding cassette transporter
MDEATASLDAASETRLYTLLRQCLPDTCIVSTGHHTNLAQFHTRRLRLEHDPTGLGHLIPEQLSEMARPSASRKR